MSAVSASRRSAPESGRAALGLPVCPVCGCADWSEPRAGTRLRGCPRCQTVLHDRAASRQDEEARYDHCASTVIFDESPVAVAQWRWVRSQLLGRPDGTGLSVLDIGCGKGAFLAAAASDGASVHGLELDPAGVEICRQRGLPVTPGSLFDVGLPVGTWNVVTLWDVLDHLEDPRAALRIAAERLAPGGVIVVRGRNARIHAPMKAGYARGQAWLTRLRVPDVSVVHRWGWSPNGWLALLQAAGLGEIRLHAGIPTPGDRYGTLGPGIISRPLKAIVRAAGSMAFTLSGGRAYPFPSVLASGRKGSSGK